MKNVPNGEINEKDLPQISKFDFVRATLWLSIAYLLIFLALAATFAAIVALAIYASDEYPFACFIFAVGTFVCVCKIASFVRLSQESSDAKLRRALPLDKNDENGAELRATVAEVFERIGAEPPENILLYLSPAFYVTQRPITLFDGRRLTGRTLGVGLISLRFLTCDETKSILAREAARFFAGRLFYTTRVVPAFQALENVHLRFTRASSRYILLAPIRWTIRLFLERFARLDAKISRNREKRADFVAAKLYGKENFVSALTKTANLAEMFTKRYKQDFIDEKRAANPFENYVEAFNATVDRATLCAQPARQNEATGVDDSPCVDSERFEYVPDVEFPRDDRVFDAARFVEYEKTLTQEFENSIAPVRTYLSSRKVAADPASSNAETPAASSFAPSADADQKLSDFVETRFGFCYRNKIRLDSQTLQIGRETWPTSDVEGFALSACAHFVKGVPAGTVYEAIFRVADRRKKRGFRDVKARLNKKIFESFCEIATRSIGERILRDWIVRLQSGEKIAFETIVLSDGGVVLPNVKKSFLKPATAAFFHWKDVSISIENGFLFFHAAQGKYFAAFSILTTINFSILQDVLQRFYEVGDGELLSSILATPNSDEKIAAV